MEIYNEAPLSEIVHVGCSVLFYVLLSLTSDVVLGMDWLHTINLVINWNNYLLSLVCVSETYIFRVPTKVVLMHMWRFVH